MRSCFRCEIRAAIWSAFAAIAVAAQLEAADDLRLIRAVKTRDLRSVHSLLKQRVDVNLPQGDGTTALHWAARVDDMPIVDALLRAGARPGTANDNGATPLHLACINRNGTIVEKLLKAGAAANAALLNGETVLMTCARTGTTQGVRSLLLHRADVNAKETSHDQTALMWAAAQGRSDVVRLLIEAGADVRVRSRIYPQFVVGEDTQRAGREELTYTVRAGGMTPLLFAARGGDAESVRLLVRAGSDPSERRADGASALIMATYSGRTEAAVALLDVGADSNDAETGFTALHAAVLKSDLAVVNALLAHGANPNARMTKGTPKRRDAEDFNLPATLIGSTPYLLAAKFLEPEILRALKQGGADSEISMPNGATPLMLAAGMGSSPIANRRGVRVVDFGKVEPESRALESVATVLSLGADVNAANRAGDTALHSAAGLGYTTVITFLVEHGADVNARNRQGATPLGSLLASAKGRRSAAADPDGIQDGGNSSNSPTVALLRKLGGLP